MSKIPCFSSTTLKILDRVKFCGLKFPHLCNEDTPIFWPGEFDGLYSLWSPKELDMTE